MAGQPPLPPGHQALFESYWLQLEGSSRGDVNAITVGAFLKKSQLKDATLQKIWDLSDPTGKGYLDKQGLFTALRLVAACQLNREPSLASIMPTDPPPKLVGVDLNRWTIDTNEKARYIATFESLQPVNGLVSGQKAKQILMRSNLPIDKLGKIWALSDIDRDGNLDVEEFAVAMKLTQLCHQGENIPFQLPPSLIPPSKAAHLGLQSTAASNSHPPTTAGKSMSDWVITPDVKAKYDTYFDGIDKDHVGLVTGDQARGLFMASNLPQQMLAFIWRLVDIEQSGKLNKEQFALAMYLISERVRGRELPQELPPHMIPPSKRTGIGAAVRPGQSVSPAPHRRTPPLSQASNPLSSLSAPSTSGAGLLQTSIPTGGGAGILQPNPPSSSVASVQGSSSFPGLQPIPSPSLSPSSSGLLQPSTAAAASTAGASGLLQSMTHVSSSFSHPNFPLSGGGILQPVTSSTATSASSTGGGFATDFSSGQQGFKADFAAIRELDVVSGEIESIAKEKLQLNEDIAIKQEQVRQRHGEINNLQAELEESTRQRDELERQKSEAQNQLENLDNEKARIEKDMADLKEQCAKEREEIEHLKAEMLDQEASKSQQEQEMNKQLLQLETLRKEHEELKNRVETSRAELNRMQAENQTVQRDINQVQEQIDRYKKEQQILTVQLSQLPSRGSQGTPPSVINISELPSEVPGTHLTVGEADAISARATAGSSSPVSSISGFSTNSHLDDQPEDRERTETLTAGASTGHIHPPAPPPSTASDPFAAFTGDPFGSTAGSSTSNTTNVHTGSSAFDPFDLSLFKIGNGGGGTATCMPTTSTSGGFAHFPSISSTTTPKSTDPFSSQDPFSSDPFASSVSGTQSKPDGKPSWSVEGAGDPFATPTGGPPGGSDPFSSDPFYSDPFGQGVGVFGSARSQPVTQGFETDPFLSMPDPSGGNR